MVFRESRQALRIPRRTFLQVGGIGSIGLNLEQVLHSQPAAGSNTPTRATAKSCIMLYMLGGPPQQETFDIKPDAPVGPRSLFPPTATSVPGIQICSFLPRLARNANHLAIIRSTYHGGNALFYGAGVHFNLTGWPNEPREGEPLLDRRDAPCIGAVLQQLRGGRNGLPAFVQLPMWIAQDGPGREWAGQNAGFLGRTFDPLVMTYDRAGGAPGTLPTSFVLRDDIGPKDWLGVENCSGRWSASSPIRRPVPSGNGIRTGSMPLRCWLRPEPGRHFRSTMRIPESAIGTAITRSAAAAWWRGG